MDRFDRAYGALLGLALGDAMGYPALFHRIFSLPEKRRTTIWNANRTLSDERIGRLFLPFTHRTAPETLAPAPTDDTEWALLSARAILDGRADAPGSPPSRATFLAAWERYVLAAPEAVVAGFSERAAMDNLRRGLLPPATGNDNPQHYDDSAAVRAVISGIVRAGDPCAAATLAQTDAEITNAEDGITAARAIAAAIALLMDGAPLATALTAARAEFPADSWIAHNDRIARECLAAASAPLDLALHLTCRLINSVYTFGNVAPETIPAAFVLCEATGGDLTAAVLVANAIPKSADSLPALVGALCGALRGPDAVPPAWRDAINAVRGICLPALAGTRLDDTARTLIEAVDDEKGHK
jgi:ADP-ribosylglycohydrolase